MSFLILFLQQFTPSAIRAQTVAIDYAKRIDTLQLKSFLDVLTSDSLEGRETGKRGQRRAADYISSSFFSFGLKPLDPDTLNAHPLSPRANKGVNLKVNDQLFAYFADYFVLSSEKDTSLHADTVYFIGYGTNLSNKHQRAPESVPVMYFQSEQHVGITESHDPFQQIEALAAYHPSLLIIVSEDFRTTADSLLAAERKGASVLQRIRSYPFPIVWISTKTASAFHEKARQHLRKHKKRFRPYWFWSPMTVPVLKDHRSLLGHNVPFLLTGTEKPEEVVLVTAHYDHLGMRGDTIWRGADDDASGTSAVLEMAHIFSMAAAEGHAPRRSVLFMPVSGEEKGLLGSAHYASNPLFPLSNLVADVNIDMIGRIDPEHDSTGIHNYIYVIGSDKLSTELHTINEEANNALPHLELDYRYNVPGEPNRFYYRSDHYNFARHGVPSIFYFNGKHDDYHKHTDTPEKIDYAALSLRTKLAFLTVWELANRPQRIVVDRTNDMDRR
ncbi:MAG: M28 family peptidase [Bacteroidota bacterium]